jgi:putative ABC transport system permease protein
VLVVVEVALAVVLLTGAGLMIKSFGRLIATRSGVDPENVLTMRINLPQAMFATGAATFFQPLEQRVAALPGVVSTGLSNCHALAGGCNGTIIWFRDRPPVTRGTEPSVGVHFVLPDYFKTMRIPVLRGRTFGTADSKGSPKVVMVSEAAARKFWPGEDPVGRAVGVGQGGFGDRAEVIGVVGDVRYGQMDEPPQPDVYISYLQSSRASMVLFVRTAGNPAALTQAVEREVRALNRDLPVYDVRTMNDRIRDATSRARFSAILLAVFAGIALVLAAVGIYGVMAYSVAQRTREIGIRMALGSPSANVFRLILGNGLKVTIAGIVVGIAAAAALTRYLSTMLYAVRPTDPLTLLGTALLLVAVAMLACYLPARRATRVDPMLALRHE